MQITTPVAVIFYNRPEVLAKLVELLSAHTFSLLFLVADGPKQEKAGDAEACKQTREIAEKLTSVSDEFVRVYAPTNLGCRRRVKTGLDDVFLNCSEAIILEDDCLPDDSFFPYASKLLRLYADNPQVSHISGCNRGVPSRLFTGSYSFSKLPIVWGWATWRDAWQEYDEDLSGKSELIEQTWPGKNRSIEYWNKRYERVQQGDGDSWAFHWQFSLWRQGKLSVVPTVNMVENIGFGVEDSTHTANETHWQGDLTAKSTPFPLVHPEIKRNFKLDQYFINRIYKPKTWYRRMKQLYQRIK